MAKPQPKNTKPIVPRQVERRKTRPPIGYRHPCLLDLLMEGQRISAAKLWFNVAHAVITVVFIRSFWNNPVDWETIMAYGAIVGGSKVADKYFASKGTAAGYHNKRRRREMEDEYNVY